MHFIRFDECSRYPAWNKKGRRLETIEHPIQPEIFYTITNCWEPKKVEVIHAESSQDTWACVYFVLFQGGEPSQGQLCFFTVYVSYAIIRYRSLWAVWVAVGGFLDRTRIILTKNLLVLLLYGRFCFLFELPNSWSQLFVFYIVVLACESAKTKIFREKVEWFVYQHESKGMEPFRQLGNKSMMTAAGDSRPQESVSDYRLLLFYLYELGVDICW